MATYAHLASEDLRITLDQIEQAYADYQQTRDPALLSQITQLSDQVTSHPSFVSAPAEFKVEALIDAGGAFLNRFHAVGDPADLEQALLRWQETLPLVGAVDATQRAQAYFNLGAGLITRYRLTGDLTDLEQAAQANREAASLLPPDSPKRSPYLEGYGDVLTELYTRTYNPGDFFEAQAALQQSVNTTTQPKRQEMLWHKLGWLWSERFNQTGELAALEGAIGAWQNALALLPPDAPKRVSYLTNLGTMWRNRHIHNGLEADLQTAIGYYREAVQLSPATAPNRAICLSSLGNALHDRYLLSANPADLDEAVEYCQAAYLSTSADAPYRASVMSNLAVCLRSRYSRSGNLADLDQALGCNYEVLRSTPPNTAAYATALNGYGNSLLSRHAHTRDDNTLQQAVTAFQQTVLMTPIDSPDYAVYMGNWANALTRWYEVTHDLAALDKAITAFEHALAELPAEAATRANVMNLFGNALSLRFFTTADRTDLDRAIDTYQAALELLPPTAPDRWGILNNLGLHRCERFRLVQQPEDLEQAVAAFRQVCKGGLSAAPADVLNSGRNWGVWALEREAWDEAAEGLQAAIQIIEQLFPTQLLRAHKQAWLREAQGLYGLAAYAQAKVGNWQLAAVWVEQGRARLLSEVLERDRAKLEQLKTLGYADYYQQYVEACGSVAEMESLELQPTRNLRPGTYALSLIQAWSMISGFDFAGNLRVRRSQLDAALSAIRTVPGFQDFLQLPDFEQIRSLLADRQPATSGIYFVVTPYGGFALILHGSGVRGVWLDVTGADLEGRLVRRHNDQIVGGYLTRQQESEQLSAELDTLLPWLGQQIVRPVVAALQEIVATEGYQAAPTLILVPTGVLAQLPLQAAPYDGGDRLRTLLDDYPVAYTPSAQVFGQCITQLKTETAQAPSLLAIGNPLPLPAKIPELPYAAVEVEQIARLFGVEARVLQAQEATVWATESGLEHSNYLHFACHGQYQTERPLASGLLLSGGDTLTLAELFVRQSNLKFWRLVVLSACQSALTDQVWLPEEAIGLPAGFLQAGALGVIGSLWSVSDLSTSLLMLKFYEFHLKSAPPSDRGPLSPARALQRAQVWLRDATYGELTDLFDRLRHDSPSPSMRRVAQEQFRVCALRDPDERPYQHAYYWAAFAFYGV